MAQFITTGDNGGITIDDNVVVAGHCYISAQDHILTSDAPIRFQGETTQGIKIGFGAWIGGMCFVSDGVSIGNGCVVGAGSVVTKSLQSNMICFGTPCREIQTRLKFDET